jgi:flagellar assembly factor FliW
MTKSRQRRMPEVSLTGVRDSVDSVPYQTRFGPSTCSTYGIPMDACTTRYHGIMTYHEDAVLHFPQGLIGFEDETRFLPIEQPHARPIVFLQSLRTPGLCFLCLPVFVVDRDYQLEISDTELQALDLPVSRQPLIGVDVMCLTLVSIPEQGPTTANLLAPVVINIATRTAVQAISGNSEYSHQFPFLETVEALVCS